MAGLMTGQLLSLRQLGEHPVTRWAKVRGPSIAVLILAVVIAWTLAGIVWQLFPTRQDSPIALSQYAASSGTDNSNSGATTIDATPIVEAHLFGIAKKESEAPLPPSEIEDVPDTTLPLVLRGTLAAYSDVDALAIIADGSNEKLFRLEDTVRNGVTLHAVQTTQVILNRGGTLEALKLPEQKSATSAQRTRRVSNTRRAAATPNVTQVLTQNASKFTQIISPRPYFVGGQQRGYRIYPGKDRRQFQALGLRPGDIVTEINGTALNNPTQGAQIFSSLGDAQSVTVTLERNGKPQSLTLDVSQLDISNQANE